MDTPVTDEELEMGSLLSQIIQQETHGAVMRTISAGMCVARVMKPESQEGHIHHLSQHAGWDAHVSAPHPSSWRSQAPGRKLEEGTLL